MRLPITVDFRRPNRVEKRHELIRELELLARRVGVQMTIRAMPDSDPPAADVNPAHVCRPFDPSRARGVGRRS